MNDKSILKQMREALTTPVISDSSVSQIDIDILTEIEKLINKHPDVFCLKDKSSNAIVPLFKFVTREGKIVEYLLPMSIQPEHNIEGTETIKTYLNTMPELAADANRIFDLLSRKYKPHHSGFISTPLVIH